MIKRIAIIVLLFVLFVSFSYAINTPALHTDGKYIKDPSGNIVILRGTSFVSVWAMGTREGPRYTYYSTLFPEGTEVNRIKALIELATDSTKGWYSRVLRFPVYPIPEDVDPGWSTCTSDQLATYKTLLQTAIDYATSKGVYCIIDWHYIKNYDDKLATTQAFWDYAAVTYKNYTNVLFEIYNEPIYDNDTNKSTDWTTWKNTIAQPVIDRIRNVNGATNLILCGSPNWSQVVAPIASNPCTGSNIVYVAHIYPYHYDTDNTLAQYIGTTKDILPVFFTEWGFQNGAAMPCDAVNEDAYAAFMQSYFNTNGISWTGWCFDPYWQPVMFSNWDFVTLLGTSLPSTGGYQGQYIKDFLYEKRDSNLPGAVGDSTPDPTAAPIVTDVPTLEPTAVAGVTTAPTETPGPTAIPTATPVGVITDAPTDAPVVTVEPTAAPVVTVEPTVEPSSAPATGCTCTAYCDSRGTFTTPFTFDGIGEFCKEGTSLASYVNSSNTDAVNINGGNYTNIWVSSPSIAAINGMYYVYYKGSYSWSHIEIK